MHWGAGGDKEGQIPPKFYCLFCDKFISKFFKKYLVVVAKFWKFDNFILPNWKPWSPPWPFLLKLKRWISWIVSNKNFFTWKETCHSIWDKKNYLGGYMWTCAQCESFSRPLPLPPPTLTGILLKNRILVAPFFLLVVW